MFYFFRFSFFVRLLITKYNSKKYKIYEIFDIHTVSHTYKTYTLNWKFTMKKKQDAAKKLKIKYQSDSAVGTVVEKTIFVLIITRK